MFRRASFPSVTEYCVSLYCCSGLRGQDSLSNRFMEFAALILRPDLLGFSIKQRGRLKIIASQRFDPRSDYLIEAVSRMGNCGLQFTDLQSMIFAEPIL